MVTKCAGEPTAQTNQSTLQQGKIIVHHSCKSMISDHKVVLKLDEETDPIQNDQDPEADSEEEHVADEPGAGGEYAETNPVSTFSTARRAEKEEEKEEA